MLDWLIPHRWLIKGATYALAVMLGLYWGSHMENVRIQKEERAASAIRQAKNHEEMIVWYRDRMKEIRLAHDQEQRADQLAHEAYENLLKTGTDAIKGARTQLSTMKGTIDGLRKANEQMAADFVPNPGCVLPPSMRDKINSAIASINNHPAIRRPEAIAAAPVNGPDTTSAVLTCGELTDSVIDLLEHDVEVMSRYNSLQIWVNEVVKPTE